MESETKMRADDAPPPYTESQEPYVEQGYAPCFPDNNLLPQQSQGYPIVYYPHPQYPMGYVPQQHHPIPQSAIVINQPMTGNYTVIENNLVKAILVTIFCFWPTGIVAILRASEANTRASQGDTDGALRNNSESKKFIIISVVVGCILIAVAVLLPIIFILVAVM